MNVLFLCTGNSARSILAEAILAKIGADKCNSYSAGSTPKDNPHPAAIRLLQSKGYDTFRFRSKSWLEFSEEGAPKMDVIFTVCDNAAGEACPIWPGLPMTFHWGLEDPAAVEGPQHEIDAAFNKAFEILNKRIRAFVDAVHRVDNLEDLKHTIANLTKQG